MGTACSNTVRACAEKPAASGARCKTFKRCTPEDKIPAKQPQQSRPPKGRPQRQQSRPGELRTGTVAAAEASVETSETAMTSVSPIVGKSQVDKLRLEKNLKKMRQMVRDVVGQLNHFQVWMKNMFNKPDDCFETLGGHAKVQQIELHTFLYNAEIQGFKGSAERVFYGLCDEHSWTDGLVITRAAFLNRMACMGNPIRMVIRQAISMNSKKIKQSLARKRQSMLSQGDIDLLVSFRDFVKPIAKSPEKVFDAIAGDDGCVDEEEFVAWLSERRFSGDAHKVFHYFCDPDGIISRVAFGEMLATCEKLKPEVDADADIKDQKNQSNAKHKTLDVTEAGIIRELSSTRESKGLRRASTVTLASATQEKQKQGKYVGEQAKALKNSSLDKRNTSALDPASMNGSRTRSKSAPPECTDVVPLPKSRLGSNNATSLDEDPVTAATAGQHVPPSAKSRLPGDSKTSDHRTADVKGAASPPATGSKVASSPPKAKRQSSATSLCGKPVAVDASNREASANKPNLESGKPKRKASAKAKSSASKRAQSEVEIAA